MPKKKHNESASKQAARFAEEAQKLIDAGELSPTDADAALERIADLSAARPTPPTTPP